MESWKMFMNYRRMRHIKRCNNFPTLVSIDVAQHSYYTTMLSMLFADECVQNTTLLIVIDMERLLRKSLLHDTEEAFTSDIPYPIKHASESIHDGLENVIHHKMIELIGENSIMLDWEFYRKHCKNGIEGSIVSFCDMLELALWCYEEYCIGNRNIISLLDNCNKYLDELLNESVFKLYGKSLSVLKEQNRISELIPSIWYLRQMVQRDEVSGEYKIHDFVADLP